MTTHAIYIEPALGEPNTIILHVPVHYPGIYKQKDEVDYKKRLAVLKRAMHRIKQEMASAQARIDAENIKASGQIDLETQINEQVQHVKNKTEYE